MMPPQLDTQSSGASSRLTLQSVASECLIVKKEISAGENWSSKWAEFVKVMRLMAHAGDTEPKMTLQLPNTVLRTNQKSAIFNSSFTSGAKPDVMVSVPVASPHAPHNHGCHQI